MTSCNCCNREVHGTAWCSECVMAYTGSTATGLTFRCDRHDRNVEIIISFELGSLEDESE